MNILKRLALCATLFAGAVLAQTNPAPDPTAAVPTDTNVAYQPSYYVGGGANYDFLGKTPSALTVLAVKFAPSTYNITSLNLSTQAGNTAASIQTGVGRIVEQYGYFTLMVLGEGGVMTIPNLGLNVGTIGVGGALHFDVGAALHKDHLFATAYFTEQVITSQQVKPVFGITVGKTF